MSVDMYIASSQSDVALIPGGGRERLGCADLMGADRHVSLRRLLCPCAERDVGLAGT